MQKNKKLGVALLYLAIVVLFIPAAIFSFNFLSKLNFDILKKSTSALSADQTQTNGWLPGWNYRKKITISNANVSADLQNFPLLVNVSNDGDLPANAKPDQADLRFTAGDGQTLLNYEKEGNGKIWVKVPLISSSAATDIYVYYGNSTAQDAQQPSSVWSSSYKAVYHLGENVGDEATGGNHKNSVTGNYATQYRNSAAQGMVSNGQVFDGLGDYINAGDIGQSNNLTVSAWVKRNSTGGGILVAKTAGSYEWELQYGRGGYSYFIINGKSVAINAGSIGQWIQLAGTYDKQKLRLYKNGILAGS